MTNRKQQKKTKKSWYGFGSVLVRVGFCKNTVFYEVFEKVGTGVGTGLVRVWYGLVRVGTGSWFD